MPLLQVRDFPASTYDLLSKVAEAENRSITQQTIFMLTQMLQNEDSKIRIKRNNALSSLNNLNLSLNKDAPSFDKLIREDRERDEGVDL